MTDPAKEEEADLSRAKHIMIAEGIRCVEMLTLCGELDGKREGETYPTYLRRLIDGLIEAERALAPRTTDPTKEEVEALIEKIAAITATGGSLAMELYPETLGRKLSRGILEQIAHIALASRVRSAGEEGYKLPCDVHLPPVTYIRKGCTLETLMVGIRAREKFPDDSTRFDLRSPAPTEVMRETLDAETIKTLLDLLDPLHGSLDEQTYDEKMKEELDLPRDAEFDVRVTVQQERDLTQAVLILEDRERQSRAALSTHEGEESK